MRTVAAHKMHWHSDTGVQQHFPLLGMFKEKIKGKRERENLMRDA